MNTKTSHDYHAGRRLVFAFIPYYRCLYDVNLNFDQRFCIDYRPDIKRLSVKVNDSYQDNFWPTNISSVSVIAGKNGAGKSSVLKWLLEKMLPYAQENQRSPLSNSIMAIATDKNLTIFHGIPNLKKDELQWDENKINIQPIDVSSWSHNMLLDELVLNPIYYSGHFDSNVGSPIFEEEKEKLWNISDLYTLQKDSDEFAERYLGSNGIREVEYLKYYHLCNDFRICRLLIDSRFQNTFGINNHPTLRLPRFIVFIVNASVKPILERRIQNLRNSITIQEGMPKISTKKAKKSLGLLTRISNVAHNQTMQRIAESERKQGFEDYLYYALQNFCYQIFDDESNELTLKYTLINLFAVDYAQAHESVIDWVKNVRSVFNRRASKLKDGLSNKSIILVDDFFDSLEEAMCFLDKLQWKDGKAFIDCVSVIKDSDFVPPRGAQIYADFFPPNYQRLHDIISTIEKFSYITYSHTLQKPTTLSSGELAMLNLYSRIRYAFDSLSRDENKGDSCILFLDEAEIGFHPEWQRQFVNKLIHFVSMMNQNRCPIQIIYTTHSPITLSDMPKECVNLLKTDEMGTTNESPENKKETFGANVFELYGDSFFMERGLIGEFASEIIMKLSAEIEDLVRATEKKSDYSIDWNEGNLSFKVDKIQNLRWRIDMIGDERIRIYLHSRLDRVDTYEEIRYHKDRLAFLEARYNNRHEKD